MRPPASADYESSLNPHLPGAYLSCLMHWLVHATIRSLLYLFGGLHA